MTEHCVGFQLEVEDRGARGLPCTGVAITRRWGGSLLHLCGHCADRFDGWIDEHYDQGAA